MVSLVEFMRRMVFEYDDIAREMEVPADQIAGNKYAIQ